MQGARRLLLGRAEVAAPAAQLRAQGGRHMHRVWELRLSHWSGPLPEFVVKLNWTRWGLYRVYDHLYGYLRYNGKPVHGFRSTPAGVPLRHVRPEHLRRHLQLEVRPGLEAGEQLPLAQGRRASSATASTRTADTRSGKGERYRATVIGPGRHCRTCSGRPTLPGPSTRQLDESANDELSALNDPLCKGKRPLQASIQRRRWSGAMTSCGSVMRLDPGAGRRRHRRPRGRAARPHRRLARLAVARATARRRRDQPAGGAARAPAPRRRVRCERPRGRTGAPGAALRPRRPADRTLDGSPGRARATGRRCSRTRSPGCAAGSRAEQETGDHTLFVGEVFEAESGRGEHALVYLDRRYVSA